VLFQGHNVSLPDGSQTIADSPLLEESKRFLSLLHTLRNLFPQVDPSTITIADCGCYEGGYSLALARKGYQVYGYEGRPDNLDRCRFLADQWQLENLKFSPRDLSQGFPQRRFDVIVAFGLLYHMDNPVKLLKEFSRHTNRALILNTHYAREDIPSRFRHKLGQLTVEHGYRGRWYQESSERHNNPRRYARSSITNDKSFWLLRSELLRALEDTGFSTVCEQFDCHYSMEKAEIAIRRNSRSQFLALIEAEAHDVPI